VNGLTDADRATIARARELAQLGSINAVREHTGLDDSANAYASAFGAAQWLLAELVAIAERLGGAR
jgi:hypothetical protein